MRIWKIAGIILCLIGFGQPMLLAQTSYRTPFSKILEFRLLSYPGMVTSPGMNRLHAMTFSPPSNEVQAEKSVLRKLFGGRSLAQAQEKAVAFFLFNMYVTTAAYREDIPSKLTLDYLGALDGFSLCEEMPDFEQIQKFYQQHRLAIKEHLAEFFEQKGLPMYDKESVLNDLRERKFLQLLTNAPMRGMHPGYSWPGTTRLQAKANDSQAALLGQMLRQSLAEGQNKVITFTTPNVAWEDWDNKLVKYNSGEIRTYRCVNDECAYCSYLFGKHVCEQWASSYQEWGLMRLYKITAYPTKEKFLLSKEGERFTLASGETAPSWYYHTAILAIMNLNGKLTPFVVDSFLAGEVPMLLEEWASLFRAEETFFQVDVFERSRLMEGAIVQPSLWHGANVVVDGKEYAPHQILE